MTDQELLQAIGRFLVPDQASRQLGTNVWGHVKNADNAASDFMNYLMGNKTLSQSPNAQNYLPPSAMGGFAANNIPRSPMGGGGGIGWSNVTYPDLAPGLPGGDIAASRKSMDMRLGSAPKTMPMKKPTGKTNDLASSLVTRPNLNLTAATSYPGYGDRGPLTVPAGSNYVPQTAPALVPGAYTIPGGGGLTGMAGQATASPAEWGPTPDYYGMQERWTPTVTGK